MNNLDRTTSTKDTLDNILTKANNDTQVYLRKQLEQANLYEKTLPNLEELQIEYLGNNLPLVQLNNLIKLSTPHETSPFLAAFNTRFMLVHAFITRDKDRPIQPLYAIVKDTNLSDEQKVQSLKTAGVAIPQKDQYDVL